MKLVGLDVGTTGCKAAIFDTAGTLLTSASREYAVDIPHPTWAEQDAETYGGWPRSPSASPLTKPALARW